MFVSILINCGWDGGSLNKLHIYKEGLVMANGNGLRILGAVAGGVIGARKLGRRSINHPKLAKLGGALLGGACGVMAANLMRAAILSSGGGSTTTRRKRRSRQSSEAFDGPSISSEIKGFVRGMCMTRAQFFGFIFLEEEIDAEQTKMGEVELSDLQFADLIIKLTDAVLKVSDEKLLSDYSIVTKTFRAQGVELKLDYGSDRKEVHEMMREGLKNVIVSQ